jgi:hypothetical protein
MIKTTSLPEAHHNRFLLPPYPAVYLNEAIAKLIWVRKIGQSDSVQRKRLARRLGKHSDHVPACRPAAETRVSLRAC